MNGAVQLFHGQPIPGPYTQAAREDWLRRLLEAQEYVRAHGPEAVREIELVTVAELEEIRRLWVVDKHEFEDRLPGIYEQATGRAYPGCDLGERLPLGAVELDLLAEICGEDRLLFETVRELLDVERRYRHMVRRTGIYGALEKALTRGFYSDQADAVARAQRRREVTEATRRPPGLSGQLTLDTGEGGL